MWAADRQVSGRRTTVLIGVWRPWSTARIFSPMLTQLERLGSALADRYRVEGELGQGGMATVYLAEDLRHKRKVALKVLKPELAAVLGADRFVQEITTTAALQHPHILPLFDSGTAQGFLYYVMPYIEGETLRAKLNRETQLGIEEAVRIASEVADALDYAHRHGVIHRDIKPENILLHDGRPVVADFGIALAVSAAAGGRMTETGLSLGTPHYMSPEQATAEKEITARSDIYSLAAVLYEMLAGHPPHTGATAQQIVMKIVAEDAAPVTRERKSVPPPVAAAVAKALEKLPADRFASAADFARALAGQGPPGEPTRVTRTPTGARSDRLRHPALGWICAGLLAVVAAALAWYRRPTAAPSAPVLRFGVDIPSPARLGGTAPAPRLSPDGRRLVIPAVMNAKKQLYVISLDEGAPRLVPAVAEPVGAAFSPDGRWLAFRSRDELVKVAVDGGSPIVLTDASGLGVAWGDDGSIVYNRKYNAGLWRISSGGGAPDSITAPDVGDGELGHFWPQIVPGGAAVIFTAYRNSVERSRIKVVSLRTRAVKTLVEGATDGRLLPDGRLVFYRGGDLLAVPFDPRRLEVTGSPVPVLQHVGYDRLGAQAAFDVSETGTLAWVPDSELSAPARMVWLSRDGRDTDALEQSGIYYDARLSPDGRHIAFAKDEPTSDVWVADLATGTQARLTHDPGIEGRVVWSADGRRVIYQGEHGPFAVYSRAADAGDTSLLLSTGRYDRYPWSVTPDGRWVVGMEDSLVERLVLMSLAEPGRIRPFGSSEFDRESPALSPDGRWVAYASDESGDFQLYLSPFDTLSAGSRQLTRGGITTSSDYAWIRWSKGGREILYLAGDSVMSVPFDPSSGSAGAPTLLLRTPYRVADVTRDGQRLLAIKTPVQTAPRRVRVVVNWLGELRAKAP
jgi:serine/threonine-protein kinase